MAYERRRRGTNCSKISYHSLMFSNHSYWKVKNQSSKDNSIWKGSYHILKVSTIVQKFDAQILHKFKGQLVNTQREAWLIVHYQVFSDKMSYWKFKEYSICHQNGDFLE